MNGPFGVYLSHLIVHILVTLRFEPTLGHGQRAMIISGSLESA